ncbi:hypothetical protein [Bacillus velezensis]|uniref:hypothetical protein n=1 Tax=Bacillus velezensis TaxID=492670 RepID=UPI0018E87671|nr:hypothetical protein [Bacillus velezensis]
MVTVRLPEAQRCNPLHPFAMNAHRLSQTQKTTKGEIILLSKNNSFNSNQPVKGMITMLLKKRKAKISARGVYLQDQQLSDTQFAPGAKFKYIIDPKKSVTYCSFK